MYGLAFTYLYPGFALTKNPATKEVQRVHRRVGPKLLAMISHMQLSLSEAFGDLWNPDQNSTVVDT